MKDFILSRLREPSSMAGIAALIGGMAIIPHATDVQDTLMVLGNTAAALLAIWLPEKPKQ